MTTHPIGSQSAASPSQWYAGYPGYPGSPGYPVYPGYPGYPGSPTCNRAYLLAGVRAGLIALVLLTVLVGIVVL